MKQKAKSLIPYSALLLLLIIFSLSVIESSKYQAPATQQVSVAQLKNRLAKSSTATASDQNKHSTVSVSATASTNKVSSQAKSTKLSNTGPGNVLALFLITMISASVIYRRIMLRHMREKNSA